MKSGLRNTSHRKHPKPCGLESLQESYKVLTGMCGSRGWLQAMTWGTMEGSEDSGGASTSCVNERPESLITLSHYDSFGRDCVGRVLAHSGCRATACWDLIPTLFPLRSISDIQFNCLLSAPSNLKIARVGHMEGPTM